MIFVPGVIVIWHQVFFLECRACPEAWVEVPRGVVADEPDSDSQGLYREMQARRRDSETVARRTET